MGGPAATNQVSSRFRRVALAVAVAAAAPAARAGEYTLAPGSQITYHVHHPLHEVYGVSTQVAALKPIAFDPERAAAGGGLGEVVLQSPWAGFASGNANRDSNTRTIVHAGQYPVLTFVLESLQLPHGQPGPVLHGTAAGRMYINGRKQPLTAAVALDVADPTRIEVRTTSRIDMTAWGIEPPSLLLIAADPWVDLAADLWFVPVTSPSR